MFGFNPSGEYPFGNIKKVLGAYYTTQQNEFQSITDNNNGIANFIGNVLESQSLDDIEKNVIASFVGNVLESQSLEDKQNTIVSFINSILESQTISDYNNTFASFVGNILESQSLSNINTSISAKRGYGFGINVSSDAILNFDNTKTCDLITEQNTLSYHYGNSFVLTDCKLGNYCYQTIIKNYSSNRNLSLNAFISGGELRARVIFNPVTKQFLTPTYSYLDPIIDYGYMELNNDFIMVYMIFNHTTMNDALLFRVQLYNNTNATYLGSNLAGMYIGGSEIKYSESCDSYIYNSNGISQRDYENLYIYYLLPTNDFSIYLEWTPTCFTNGTYGTIFQTKNEVLNGSVSLDYFIQNNNLTITLSKNTNLNSSSISSNTVIYTDSINYNPPININYTTKKIALRFSSTNNYTFSGMDMFINGKKCIGNADNSNCIVDSKFTIGNDYTNTNADNSYHKNFQVFNKIITDIKLINITSI